VVKRERGIVVVGRDSGGASGRQEPAGSGQSLDTGRDCLVWAGDIAVT
jgi:hypothetical protein